MSSLGLRPGHSDYARATLALFCLGIAAFAQLYTVQPLLVPIGEEFGVGAANTSWLMSAATAGIALAVLPIGHYSGRWGRRRTMLIGLALATLAGLGLVLSQNFPLLTAIRALQGAALSTVLVSAMAWVIASAHPFAVTRLGGLYIAGTTVGGMTGRLVAGYVAELGTWRTGVIAATIVAAAAGGAAHLLLPGGEVYEDTGAVADQPDPYRRARFAMYAIGGLGMATFVGIFNVMGYRLAGPPFFVGTAVTSTLFLTYLAGTATSAVAGRVAGRIGLKPAVLVGLAVAAGGVALTLVDSIVVMFAGMLVLCAGFFLAHALASSNAARYSLRPAAASSRYSLSYYAGSSIGGVLLGYAWEGGGWVGTVAGAAALLALAALIVVATPRAEPSSDRAAS
ncbi:MFS transporter [Bowdeniella nasicola]|uniref:MFS transporter n=1 Tax=Bowdeniella nasicola TaxID=208480 RepID=UPI00130190DE|nr:MFS transporter [Bowdeniella nasicola]